MLSTGENVTPALVENLVKESDLISHCILYGDGGSDCIALITIDETEAANMCVEQIEGLVQQAVARANARLSTSEQIRCWKILDRDLSADRHEVTRDPNPSAP